MTTTIRAGRLALAGTCVSLAASAGLSVPPAAAASTIIGSPCVAANGDSAGTVVRNSTSDANPLPITPVERSVITRATFNVPFLGANTFLTTLKTVRSTGVTNEYTVVAQSGPLLVSDSVNTFDVRVPIAAGDLLGARGYPAALMCESDDLADGIALVVGDLQPGQTATFMSGSKAGLPVLATVEPDVDGDGFGDDTQDECPRSASTQGACPIIALDSSASANRKQRSLVVLVSASNPAQVTVTGTTKVNGRSIKVKLTATTSNVLGEVWTDTSSVRATSNRGRRGSRH